MDNFKLLMPHEVLNDWPRLRTLLSPAVDAGGGELSVDDIRQLVLSGRMFLFASALFAVAVEFVVYPKKTVMNIAYGGGRHTDRDNVDATLVAFAKQGGAESIQSHCTNPAMTRYYRRWFKLAPIYTVLEKQL